MRRARRPHDGAAAVGKRQEGDRTVGKKPLPRGARMRMLGADVGHERPLVVVPSGGLDARELPAERGGAVGSDHQRRAQRASVAERHHGAIALERHAGQLGAQQRDRGETAEHSYSAHCSRRFSTMWPRFGSLVALALK